MFGITIFHGDTFTQTLLGLAVVLAGATLVGRLFTRMRQPAVIGEILLGILLGPSLLGHASQRLFPLNDRPMLRILAEVGLTVFMFIVGLQMDLTELRVARRHGTAAAVAGVGTLVSFGLGVAVSLVLLHDGHAHAHALAFSLFIGVSLSTTAFPVLARIVKDRGIDDTPMGQICLLAAGVSDVGTWIVLALVLALVESGGWTRFVITVIGAAVLVLVLVAVRPALLRLESRYGERVGLPVIVGLVLLCSAYTSAIGLNEVFGAFALGAVIPRGPTSQRIQSALAPLCACLLPVYFVVTGLSVDIRSLNSSGVADLFLVIAAACLGKFGGATLGALSRRLSLRESAGIGILMNTRGLTEIVVLTVGLDAGILDTRIFTVFVLMALVTTAATAPVLQTIRPNAHLGEAESASASRSLPPLEEAFS